jgi:hypothetical protein
MRMVTAGSSQRDRELLGSAEKHGRTGELGIEWQDRAPEPLPS